MRSDGEERSGTQKALALIGTMVFVAALAVAGLVTFLRTMETPLYPNAADVPSVTRTEPLPQWADAVKHARETARAQLVERNLPGLSIAVGVEGEIVWAEAFGWADLEKKVPAAPETRFRIGHASKTLTSAAVGLLVEDGTLSLDDEIQRYVPAFPQKQWPVTLRHLMGHVAGIRHYGGENPDVPSARCQRASEGLAAFADDPLRFQPESQYGYSTYGWVLVSAAVEAAANEPFFTFMRARIFEPSGMRATTIDSATESIPDRATFYDPRLSGDPAYGPAVSPGVDYSCFAGAGAFVSTPSDMVRFGMGFIGGTLVKPATAAMLQTPQQLLSGEETSYGLGWMLESAPVDGVPAQLAGHSSLTLLGSSTSFITAPEHGIVVAAMSNTSDASLRAMAVTLVQLFAERKAQGPPDRD